MVNKGYMTAKATDEYYTPKEAVKPILKYLAPGAVVWCPFDDENSEYVKCIRAAGHEVIYSHIKNGQDFFSYEPQTHYDCIISNPPFSIKDRVLNRLVALKKPFAILLPLPTLQGQKRFDSLRGGQALIFDKRINFYTDEAHTQMAKGVAFASIYFCKNFLPNDLIFERL